MNSLPDDEIDGALREAMLLHQRGDLQAADRLYDKVLEKVPAESQALRLKGVLARQLGDYLVSLEILNRLRSLAPNDALAADELALTQLAAGQLYAAEMSLRDALDLQPDSLRALANLGALLQRRGHVEPAIECYRDFLELEPDDLEVQCNLANALMEAGRSTEAKSVAENAHRAAPRNPLLLASHGALLCGLNEFVEAKQVLGRALELNPGDDMAFVNLGYAHRRLGDPAAALDALSAAVRANPMNARAIADLANIEVELGRIEQSLARCEKFLARFPGERLVLAAFIQALRDAGRIDEAVALQGSSIFLHVTDIDTPKAFDDHQSFNEALVAAIESHTSLIYEPVRKATEGGAQTGELNPEDSQAIAALQAAIIDVVDEQRGRWMREGLSEHPAMAFAGKSHALRLWGTVLESGGRQAPHLHPLGWLSGVYYPKIPDDLTAADPDAGCLEFGSVPESFFAIEKPPTHRVVPKPGRLVLFPSYWYHRTLPFNSSESRFSLAFDVVPVVR